MKSLIFHSKANLLKLLLKPEVFFFFLPFDRFKLELPTAISKGLYNYNLVSKLTMHVSHVKDFDKFDEIVKSKSNPTLQDVSELVDLKNKDLSFYGCYVLDIKPNEIIKISKHN